MNMFCLCFRCYIFPGRREVFSGRSLPSVSTLLVYGCQSIGRANGLNCLFALALFHFSGAGGGVFRPISTIGGCAFSILCLSAGREGELGELCFLRFSCSIFSEWGRGGARGSGFRWTPTLGGGGFNDWGGRRYDDFVPGEVIKTVPSGDETT